MIDGSEFVSSVGISMTLNSSIFGLRFGSNVALQPTQEELKTFLESKENGNGREPYGNALTAYNRLLEEVLSFQRHQLYEVPSQNTSNKLFYGVLSHSCFFNPALKSAVEQYFYHLHALETLDFVKPTAFLRAAEEATSRLNPKKKADATKLASIREMADERKKLLITLNSRRLAFVEELSHIAQYIRNNLVKIANRCETSIVILVDSQIGRKEENQLIDDIKTHFREKLKTDLHGGLVTRQHLESAQQDVALLSKETSGLLREYVFSLTRVFETIYDHVTKVAREIDALLAENKGRKKASFKVDVMLFTRIERVLVELMSGAQFALATTDIRTDTAHISILMEKRNEMLGRLYELMQKERRSWSRRHREKRRREDGQLHKGVPLRSGKDRRTAKDRRKFESASL
jgi:hypothetical protein